MGHLSRGNLGDAPDDPFERAFDEMVQTLERREEAFRQVEERYRQLVEGIPAVLYAARPDASFATTYISPYIETLVGYSPGEWTGDDDVWSHRIHPDDQERVLADWKRALDDRCAGTSEYRLTTKAGRVVWVRDTRSLTRDSQGRPLEVRGFLVDITEQKRFEEELRQSQKMEAIGRLASGVTHDFNNVLTIITGYSDLLMERLKPGDPLREHVEEINTAGYRATSLTRQLLSFSRKQEWQPGLLDLNAIAANMEFMLRRLIGEDIDLNIAANATLATVRADRSQVEQVIVNLAVNARDAMPTGGLLTIETMNMDLDDTFARLHAGVRPGPYVLLAVSDTGIGMDGETKSHLFEPFFTTKEKGKGTGLGLSIVYGIVKQAGGHIWAYSEPGRGACFKIYFPQVNLPATEPPSEHEPAVEGGEGETILVVEDENCLLDLISQTLIHRGFRVLQAREGAEAITLAQKFEGQIDLMLTDSVMPYMSGRELARRLGGLLPKTKVLYMSGYTGRAMADAGILEAEDRDFIQKPFSADALVRKIRLILDAPPGKPS